MCRYSRTLTTRTPGALRRCVIVIGMVIGLSSCAQRFDRYEAGGLKLWIGPQAAVQHECEARGSVRYSTEAKIFGCTDFARHTIISVSQPAVIAHELCHWIKQTPSHVVCPPPLLPSSAKE
jgi:hypothetical protein